MKNPFTALVDKFVEWTWARDRDHLLELVSEERRYIAKMILNNLREYFKTNPPTSRDVSVDHAMRIVCYAIEQSNVVNLVSVVPVTPNCPKVTSLEMRSCPDVHDVTQLSLVADTTAVTMTKRTSDVQIPLSTADYGDHINDCTQLLQHAGLELAIELEKTYMRIISMLATTQESSIEFKTASGDLLAVAIQAAANTVARLSRRGVANVVVIPSSLMQPLLTVMNAHHYPDMRNIEGLQYIGTLNNMKVLVNWNAIDTSILVGFAETRHGPGYKGIIVDGGVAFVPSMLAIPSGTAVDQNGSAQYSLKNEFGSLIQKNAKNYYVKLLSK